MKGLKPFLIEAADEIMTIYAANEYDAKQQFDSIVRRRFSLVIAETPMRTLR